MNTANMCAATHAVLQNACIPSSSGNVAPLAVSSLLLLLHVVHCNEYPWEEGANTAKGRFQN